MDLEAEFEKIMSRVLDDIERRCVAGEFTAEQASALTLMVEKRMDPDSVNYDAESDLSGWNNSQACW